MFNRHAPRALVVAALSAAAVSAQAAGTDFSTLTSAVDFGTVVTALVAIGAVLMLPKVAKFGITKVLSMIRG